MLSTDRLKLRQWREEDLAPFAVLNADPDVMRYFPSVRTRAESDETYARLHRHIEKHGFGFWAAEMIDTGQFIGFIGMEHCDYLPSGPAVEIGWRLDKSVWGQGLAPEGARACLAYAFSKLGLDEVVSFTADTNTPSMRVMEKIGMRRDEARDFDHPSVAEDTGLKSHVFYAICNTDPIGR